MTGKLVKGSNYHMTTITNTKNSHLNLESLFNALQCGLKVDFLDNLLVNFRVNVASAQNCTDHLLENFDTFNMREGIKMM